MSQDQIFMYTEYFQTVREYLVHLQSLVLLLLTACSYFFLKSQDKLTEIISGLAFLANLINLIIGLFAYSKTLSIILDLKVNPTNADLMTIGNFVWAQVVFSAAALLAIIYCALRGRYAK